MCLKKFRMNNHIHSIFKRLEGFSICVVDFSPALVYFIKERVTVYFNDGHTIFLTNMQENPLNEIINHGSNWICTVFELDRINAGGLYISTEDFAEMDVAAMDCHFRVYKSKKIVVSGAGQPEKPFCVLDVQYDLWKCMCCKKISRNNEPECYCGSYNKCWTPIRGSIVGVRFIDSLDFDYRMHDNNILNIIYE